ncbi:hypothetical protein [Yersinia pseudotuberculosis]|uniref:hypothetical protein n=1 Tax=Yersinia pseudotuberculosis TaxID=633 RepID=UPI0038B615E2
MLGLILKDLKIRVQTNNGLFGVDIPFTPGLNIIRAENSSGKSTCVNAIAYALGLEAVLGPSRKKPFPRCVTKALREQKPKDESIEENIPENYVNHSYVELILSSPSGETAKIHRDIKGLTNKVSVQIGNKWKDYFLGVSGAIGSAKSDNGFHYWLEHFINWKMPSLTTYDGKPTRLYLECVFPLFFIEQKRGWSEIQANTPTQYGIKNLKKSALEFCLGLEDYDKQNKVSELRLIIKDLEEDWERNQSAAASLAEFTNSKMTIKFKLDNKNEFTEPFAFYIRNGESETDINSLIHGLKINIDLLRDNYLDWPLSKTLEDKLHEHRYTSIKLESYIQRENSLIISVSKADKKITQINYDLDRYRQLKRLRDVGSKQDLNIEIKKCPICDSDMLETFSHVNSSIKPLTIDQNIDYLKNQYLFYTGIKEKQNKELLSIREDKFAISENIKSIESDISSLKNDEELHLSIISNSSAMRQQIELENHLRDLQKTYSQLSIYNTRARNIYNDWSRYTNALVLAIKSAGKNISEEIINQLEQTLKNSLFSFGYDRSNLDYIKISRQTLRPELDGYDIVADSSASDYIRIIWSYTLALMELGAEFEKVKHSGFVVFDEPRQHEANKKSFNSLLGKSSSMAQLGGQVIVATSISTEDLVSFKLDSSVNINIFNDSEYILKKINS